MKQPFDGLSRSASAADTLFAPVLPPPVAPNGGPDLLSKAQSLAARLDSEGVVHSCQVRLRVGFFFDGTGNNLDADVGTDEHSNVARLFKAYPDN